MERKEIITNVKKSRRVVSGPDYRDVGAVLLFIFLLPYVISFFFGNAGEELFQEDYSDAEFIVCNTTAAGTEMMPLETYLVSRLPSTIDMGYEPEALKAQTVVLRTELMRVYEENKEENKEAYGGGSIIDTETEMETKTKTETKTETKTGKVYIPVESEIRQTDGETYEKAKEAVDATRGMYLTYNGYPVKAPYFAVSAGATRNGNEVFDSEEYDYLKSVMCERDFTSDSYAQSVRINKKVFYGRLQEVCPGIEAEQGAIQDLFHTSRDRADYVTEIGIGRVSLSGENFRNIFSLNSSCFELEEEKDTVLIKTRGVGHGLGLCQYGANEAAKKGSDFIDILNYFFSGVVIEKTE